MTTNQDASNRPVFTIAGQIAQLDSRDDSARFALFVKLYDAGIKADDLTAKGDAFADFRDGYLVAWQGADFAKVFDGAAGKVELTGKVIDRLTGKSVKTVMTKTAWQMALASKIAKARTSYAAWLAAGEPKADNWIDRKSVV